MGLEVMNESMAWLSTKYRLQFWREVEGNRDPLQKNKVPYTPTNLGPYDLRYNWSFFTPTNGLIKMDFTGVKTIFLSLF